MTASPPPPPSPALRQRAAGVRLLAIDIDGTLLDRSGRLLPSTAQAIARAASAGIRPVLCTGRRHRRARPVAEQLGLDAPLVCNSGAVVKSRHGDHTLHRADLPPGIAAELVRLFESRGHRALSFLDDPADGADFVTAADPSGDPYLDRYLDVNRGHGRYDPAWKETIDRESHYHVCCFGEFEAMRPLAETALERFGAAIQPFVQRSPSGLGFVCEIVRGDASKWSAVLSLAGQWGIHPGEIAAIGDDMNDLAMIRHAALGVAMGHAPEAVRAAADWITADHDHDGLTRFIDDLLLADR